MAVEETTLAPAEEAVPADDPKADAAEGDEAAGGGEEGAEGDAAEAPVEEPAEEQELAAEPSAGPLLPVIEPSLLEVVVERYEGEYDKYGQYEGKGIAFFVGGHVYTGDFSNGRLHGQGTYLWSDEIKYEGSFEYNSIEGSGTFSWPGGGKYEGEVRKGKRHGWGKLSFADAKAYFEGTWVDGVREGPGKLVHSKYESYDGNWSNDMMSGFGTYTYESGNVYEGAWKEDKKHGKGTMRWLSGNEVYEGDWKNGLMHGQGEHVWLQAIEGVQFLMKNCYKGEFAFGKRHGKGTFTYATGACYVGDWVDNVKEGMGTFTYEDGTVYTGPFVNDKPEVMQKNDEPGGQNVRINIDDLLAQEDDPSESMRAVSNLLLRYNSELRMIYRHYAWLSVAGSDPANGKSFTISMPQYWRFCKDCRLPSPSLPMAQLDIIAVKVNVHGEQLSSGRAKQVDFDDVDITGDHAGSVYVDPHNPDNALLYREFVEAIVRIGHHLFHELPLLERRVHRVLNANILPNAGKAEPDGFVARFEEAEVRAVVDEHHAGLKALFSHAAALLPDPDGPQGDTVNAREFLRVLKDTDCIGKDLSARTALRAFKLANFCEERTWRDASGGFEEEEEEDIFGLETEMIIGEFIEGVARCADLSISGDYPLAKKLQQFVKKMLQKAEQPPINLKY